MSKLLKKLKPGVRVIDIKSGKEGWVTYDDLPLPNSITVEFELNENNNVGAISYPILDIENRIKLAPKYGNYKVGDSVKDISEDIYNSGIGYVVRIEEGVVFVERANGFRLYTVSGKKVLEERLSKKPTLKKLKAKQ